MLVISVIVLAHAGIWRFCPGHRRSLIRITLVILSVFILSALILQFELSSYFKSSTYGSDESEYFYWMSDAAESGQGLVPYIGSGLNYLRIGAFSLKTSPIRHAFIIRIINILLYSLCVNIIFIISIERLIPRMKGKSSLSNAEKSWGYQRYTKIFLISCCNGIIIWAVIRILKESLFLLLIACIFLLARLFYLRRSLFVRLFSLGLAFYFAVLLSDVRRGAEFLSLAIFAGTWLVEAFRGPFIPRRGSMVRPEYARLINGLGVLLVMAGMLFLLQGPIKRRVQYFFSYEKIYQNYYSSTLTSKLNELGPAKYLVALPRFVLGPGPYSSLKRLVSGEVTLAGTTASESAIVSTNVGNLLIFLGSLQWWVTLVFVFIALLIKRLNAANLFRFTPDFAILISIHVASYVFAYLGTGDTRHRAVMYFLAIPIVALSFCKLVNARSRSHGQA